MDGRGVCRMADKVTVLKDRVREIWAGSRKMNERWGLLVAEIGLKHLE